MVDPSSKKSPSGEHEHLSPNIGSTELNWDTQIGILFKPIFQFRDGGVFEEDNIRLKASDYVDLVDNLSNLWLTKQEVRDIIYYLNHVRMQLDMFSKGPGGPNKQPSNGVLARLSRQKVPVNQLYIEFAKAAFDTVDLLESALEEASSSEIRRPININQDTELSKSVVKLEKIAKRNLKILPGEKGSNIPHKPDGISQKPDNNGFERTKSPQSSQPLFVNEVA